MMSATVSLGASASEKPSEVMSSTFDASAQEPKLQAAGRNIAVSASHAATAGAAQAKASFVEVRRYVQENHCSVRMLSFLIALALLVFSILGVANVFNVLFKPYQYLFAFYNMIFALVIVVADGKPEWFSRCGDLQTRLFTSAAFLASQTGRAAFYFFVGSINLFMLPDSWLWQVVYFAMGGALCLTGALMLLDRWGCGGRRHERLAEEVMAAV